MKNIKFLEHTADVKFQASGETIEEAFENTALAMFDVMADISRVKPKKKIKIKSSASNKEELLIEFLNQLLAAANINYALFSKFKVKIKNNKLTAEVFGEKLDFKKH
ncbi:MAG: archease, partial [archaeon]